MLTIEALRALYVKMGGNAADVADLELTPELIEAITTIYSGGGGGSELPEVTDADNGMGLIVKEGAWDKGTLPQGLPAVTGADNGKSPRVVNGAWAVDADKFVATYTPDGQGGGTCDKTFAQIKAAYDAGKQVVAKMTMGEYGTNEAQILRCNSDETVFSVVAADFSSGATVIVCAIVDHGSNGTIVISVDMGTLNPIQ